VCTISLLFFIQGAKICRLSLMKWRTKLEFPFVVWWKTFQ
jgi:hypothetical protein